MSGVQMRFIGRIGWVMEKYQEGMEVLSSILDLRWVMAPRLDSGMTCSVGIRP
jgi:hypothetical protein